MSKMSLQDYTPYSSHQEAEKEAIKLVKSYWFLENFIDFGEVTQRLFGKSPDDLGITLETVTVNTEDIIGYESTTDKYDSNAKVIIQALSTSQAYLDTTSSVDPADLVEVPSDWLGSGWCSLAVIFADFYGSFGWDNQIKLQRLIIHFQNHAISG